MPRLHDVDAHCASHPGAAPATVRSLSTSPRARRAPEPRMKLLIGNKNYSSWSMRPWVLLTQFDIPFEEVMTRFDSFAPDSKFKASVAALSPAGKVPILVEDDGFAVWDTLAIAEYVAEKYPEKSLWPRDAKRR